MSLVCPHCDEPIVRVYVYQAVAQRQTIEFIADEPYLHPEVTYELPSPAAYRYRCGQCRGDLARYRQRFVSIFRK